MGIGVPHREHLSAKSGFAVLHCGQIVMPFSTIERAL